MGRMSQWSEATSCPPTHEGGRDTRKVVQRLGHGQELQGELRGLYFAQEEPEIQFRGTNGRRVGRLYSIECGMGMAACGQGNSSQGLVLGGVAGAS